jgi:hypothetical protein
MTAAIAPEIAAGLETLARNKVEEIIVLPREITEGQSIYRELDTFAVANAKEAGIAARFLTEAPNRRFVAQHDASSLLLQIAIVIPADLSSSLIVMAGQYVWAQIRGAMRRGLIADENKCKIHVTVAHVSLRDDEIDVDGLEIEASGDQAVEKVMEGLTQLQASRSTPKAIAKSRGGSA